MAAEGVTGTVMNEWDAQDLIEQAFAALNNGDYVRALAIGDQLVADLPDRAVVRAIRAQALLGTDSPQEAYEEACRAVELAWEDEHAHLLLAMSAWRTERLAIAQEAFKHAIALSGSKPAILSEYAWFMASERGPKLGKEAADAAVEADAASSTAWAALGLAQYRLHRRAEAEASLRRALELNPNDIYAQSAMVTLLQDRRQDGRAEALVGLLAEHAGTEDLVAAVRDEAKRRKIGRMLVERKVDVDAPPRESRSALWVWVIAAATLVGLLYSFFGVMYLPIVLVFAVILVLVLHKLID
jgi:Tfp pilus assembly protein PilF